MAIKRKVGRGQGEDPYWLEIPPIEDVLNQAPEPAMPPPGNPPWAGGAPYEPVAPVQGPGVSPGWNLQEQMANAARSQWNPFSTQPEVGSVNPEQTTNAYGFPMQTDPNLGVPEYVYHTTPYWQQIQESGAIMPMRNQPGGLGGSPDQGISLGTDYDAAMNVRRTGNDFIALSDASLHGGDPLDIFANIMQRDQQMYGEFPHPILRRIYENVLPTLQQGTPNAPLDAYRSYRQILQNANVVPDPFFIGATAEGMTNLPNEYRTFAIPSQNLTDIPGAVMRAGQDPGEIRAPGMTLPVAGSTLLEMNPTNLGQGLLTALGSIPEDVRQHITDWWNQLPPPFNMGPNQQPLPGSPGDNPFGGGQDVGAGSEASLRNAGWVPPVDPQNVVGTGHKWLEPVSMEGLHKAVDLQAYKGTPAKAPVSGRISRVQNNPEGLGLQVAVDDGRNEHILAHLDSASVRPGQQVGAGQQIARVGESGAGATGPHLDYRIRDHTGQYHDPSPLLGKLATMPRADKPPVGAGQFGFGGNPFSMLGGMMGGGGGFPGGGMGMPSMGGQLQIPQGADFRLMFSQTPTLEGMQKWTGGGNSTDVFTRKDAPLLAPFDGIVTGTGGTFGQGGPVLTDPKTGFSMRITHGQPMAHGMVKKGQPFAIVDDPSMDMLRWPGGQYGNAPGGYQHAQVDFASSPNGFGMGPMSSQGDAESILRQGGFTPTQMVPRTPGPPEGMGMGGPGGMSPGGMGMPGGGMMGPPGMMGGMPGMGMPGMGGPMGGGMPGMMPGMGMNPMMGGGMPGMGMPPMMGMMPPGGMSGMSLMGMMTPPPMGMMDMPPSPFGNPMGGNPMNMAPGPVPGPMSNPTNMIGPPMGLPPFIPQEMQGFYQQPGMMSQLPTNPFQQMGPMSGGLGGFGFDPMQGVGAPPFEMPGLGQDSDNRVGSGQFGFGGGMMGGMGGMGGMMGGMGGMGMPGMMGGMGMPGMGGGMGMMGGGMGGMGMGGMDPMSMMGGMGGGGMGGFGGGGGMDFGSMGLGGSLGMSGGGLDGISAQAFGPAGGASSASQTAADQFLQDALKWKPDMGQRQPGPYDAGVATALQNLTNLTNQPFAPWLSRFSTGTGQDVGVGQFSGNTGNNFSSTFTVDPFNAANLNLSQQQLQAQINQFNQNFGLSQQQFQAQLQQMQQQYQQAQAALYQQWLTHQDDAFFQQQLANLNASFQNAANRLQAQQFNYGMQNQGLQNQLGLYQYLQGQQQNRELANLQNQQQNAQLLNNRDLANQQNQQFQQNFGFNLANLASQQQQAGFGRQMQLYNSALQNPWLQQLAGLAPAWNAPGGPGQAGQAAAMGLATMNAPGYGPVLPQAGMDYNPAQNLGMPGYLPSNIDPSMGSQWMNLWSTLGQPGGPNWNIYNQNVDPQSLQVPGIGNWPTQGQLGPGPGQGTGQIQAPGAGVPSGQMPITNVFPGGNTTTGYLGPNGQFVQTGTGTYNTPLGGGQPANNQPAPPGTGQDVGAGQLDNQQALSDWFTRQGQQQAPFQAPNPWQAMNNVVYGSGLYTQGNDPYFSGTYQQGALPSYQTWSQLDPFQQASIRTSWELAGIPFPQVEQAMRQQWGGGGITQPENMSRLSYQKTMSDPLKAMSFGNTLDVFGTNLSNYTQGQQNQWGQADNSNVSLFA